MIFQSTPIRSRVVANQLTSTAPVNDFPRPCGPLTATRWCLGSASMISAWYPAGCTFIQSAAQATGEFFHRSSRVRLLILDARSIFTGAPHS
jgi:hypothetical protein